MIQFSFKPTPDDWSGVIRAVYLRQRSFWFALSLFAVVFVMGLWMALDGGMGGLFMLPLPLVAVYYLLFVPLTLRQQARGNPRMLAETTWNASEDHVVVRNAFQESQLDWGTFSRWAETDRYILLFLSTNKRMCQFIPRRAFADDAQRADFLALVGRHVKL